MWEFQAIEIPRLPIQNTVVSARFNVSEDNRSVKVSLFGKSETESYLKSNFEGGIDRPTVGNLVNFFS